LLGSKFSCLMLQEKLPRFCFWDVPLLSYHDLFVVLQ
jgi:hypothetical protein